MTIRLTNIIVNSSDWKLHEYGKSACWCSCIHYCKSEKGSDLHHNMQMSDLKTVDNKLSFMELVVKIIATKFPNYIDLIYEMKCVEETAGCIYIDFYC